jgi:SAM-dependent methyltransferase
VDISERMIALALEEERREPLGIQYARTSYADLGMFPSGSFDAVVSFMALMDGPRFDLAMRESFRVLRPGGLLVFSITHPCFITKGLLGAGFVLKRIEEPRPSEEYCQAHPSQRGWRDHAALFLYFRRKAGVTLWDGPRRLSGRYRQHANPRREGPAGDRVQLLGGGV